MNVMYYNTKHATKITVRSDFSFIKKIGKGGFGEVYEAKRIATGEIVALKVLDKRKLKKELLRKVCNEIEIHKTLDFPSIVKMYEWFEDLHYMYLVLEHCSNGDLHHFLKKRGQSLPENEARELFAQLVDGVIHLHKANIVHRDISLNNLLLTNDLSLKLSDFGLAKRLSGPQDTHRTMCGTPNFMSPETLSNSGRGFMGDCWSLGCVLYHLLTGELPFEDTGVDEILRRVKSGKFHIPSTVSVDARSLIGLLLQADPNNRVSAEEILKHSFMLPSVQTVLSGESADSGHVTLDSNEFSGQTNLSDDEMKVNQFIPSFTLPCTDRSKPYLPAIRNALRNRMKPATTPPSTGPLKIPRDSRGETTPQGAGTRGGEVAKRAKPECINTTRLAPLLHQRKGLVEVEICKNGSICLRRSLNTGTEEFRVSKDGMDITVLSENARQIKMSYSTLQPRWFPKYEKLSHCVRALKANTPKITIHAPTASAYYMENHPNPNFQVHYLDGYKLNRDSTRCYLTDPDKKISLATQTMTPCLDMCPSLHGYLEAAQLLYSQCVAVEEALQRVEGVIFPVRLGTRPNKVNGNGNTSFASTTTESTQSTSYLSQMAAGSTMFSDVTRQFGDVTRQFDSKCSTSTPVNELKRCPSVGQLSRSPLTPITPIRRAASMSPRRRADDVTSYSSDVTGEENKENRTLRGDQEDYVKYKPGVGWLGYTAGGVKLKFKDDSELILQDSGNVLFKQANLSTIRLDKAAQVAHKDNITELSKLRASRS